jgi:hypothetical protein
MAITGAGRRVGWWSWHFYVAESLSLLDFHDPVLPDVEVPV